MTKTLLQIALLVFGVRLLFFAQIGADPRFDQPFSDLAVYHNWAIDWSEGKDYEPEASGRPFWRSPGYPLLLSFVYRVFGADQIGTPRAVAAMQMLLGGAAVLACCAFALRRWGRTAAWTTAVLTSLHGPLPFVESLMLPDGLSVSLATFTGLGVMRLLEQEGDAIPLRGRVGLLAGGTGLLAGINAVVRPNLALAIPVACALLFLRRPVRRHAFLLAACAALPLAGTTAWNLARSGELVVTGANGPMNLYFAYGPDTGPTFDVRDHRWGNPENQARVARELPPILAAEQQGRPDQRLQPLSNKEASRYWAGRAWEWMQAHPEMVLQRALEKFLGVITWRDLAVIAPVDASRGSILVLYLLIAPFPLILFLALLGAWKRRGVVAAAVWVGFVPILVSAVMYFTYTRFRMPAVPLLALAAGPGLLELGGLRSRPREAAAWIAGALLLVAASWNPWLGQEARENRFWNTSIAHGWWQKGVGWVQRLERDRKAGRPTDPRILDRAIAAWERAKELQPQSPMPEMWIAKVERDHLGRGREACARLEDLARAYPPEVLPAVSAELAISLFQGHGATGAPDHRRIVSLFEAVQRNGGIEARHRLYWARSLRALGRTRDACEQLRQASFSPALSPEEHALIQRLRQEWGCD